LLILNNLVSISRVWIQTGELEENISVLDMKALEITLLGFMAVNVKWIHNGSFKYSETVAYFFVIGGPSKSKRLLFVQNVKIYYCV
jgi:hypothetical protein